MASPSILRKSAKTAAKKDLFTCKFCSIRFATLRGLQVHTVKHLNDQGIPCNKALKTLIIHRHNIFYCNYCAYSIGIVTDIVEHVCAHHNGLFMGVDTSWSVDNCIQCLAKCKLCRITLPVDESLQKHIIEAHISAVDDGMETDNDVLLSLVDVVLEEPESKRPCLDVFPADPSPVNKFDELPNNFIRVSLVKKDQVEEEIVEDGQYQAFDNKSDDVELKSVASQEAPEEVPGRSKSESKKPSGEQLKKQMVVEPMESECEKQSEEVIVIDSDQERDQKENLNMTEESTSDDELLPDRLCRRKMAKKARAFARELKLKKKIEARRREAERLEEMKNISKRRGVKCKFCEKRMPKESLLTHLESHETVGEAFHKEPKPKKKVKQKPFVILRTNANEKVSESSQEETFVSYKEEKTLSESTQKAFGAFVSLDHNDYTKFYKYISMRKKLRTSLKGIEESTGKRCERLRELIRELDASYRKREVFNLPESNFTKDLPKNWISPSPSVQSDHCYAASVIESIEKLTSNKPGFVNILEKSEENSKSGQSLRRSPRSKQNKCSDKLQSNVVSPEKGSKSKELPEEPTSDATLKFSGLKPKNDTKLLCNYCPMILDSFGGFLDHLDSHNDEFSKSFVYEPFKSTVDNSCQKHYSSEADLTEHLLTPRIENLCKICHQRFPNKGSLLKHTSSHCRTQMLKEKSIERCNSDYLCAICNKYLVTKIDIKKHINAHLRSERRKPEKLIKKVSEKKIKSREKENTENCAELGNIKEDGEVCIDEINYSNHLQEEGEIEITDDIKELLSDWDLDCLKVVDEECKDNRLKNNNGILPDLNRLKEFGIFVHDDE